MTKDVHKTYPNTWIEGLPLRLKEIETYKCDKTNVISIGRSQKTFDKRIITKLMSACYTFLHRITDAGKKP